jgi:hypothetical protein
LIRSSLIQFFPSGLVASQTPLGEGGDHLAPLQLGHACPSGNFFYSPQTTNANPMSVQLAA